MQKLHVYRTGADLQGAPLLFLQRQGHIPLFLQRHTASDCLWVLKPLPLLFLKSVCRTPVFKIPGSAPAGGTELPTFASWYQRKSGRFSSPIREICKITFNISDKKDSSIKLTKFVYPDRYVSGSLLQDQGELAALAQTQWGIHTSFKYNDLMAYLKTNSKSFQVSKCSVYIHQLNFSNTSQ